METPLAKAMRTEKILSTLGKYSAKDMKGAETRNSLPARPKKLLYYFVKFEPAPSLWYHVVHRTTINHLELEIYCQVAVQTTFQSETFYTIPTF